MKILPKKISQDFPSQFLKIGQQIFEAGDYDYFDFIRDSYTAKFTDKRGTYWTTLRKTNNGKYFQGLCSCNAFMQSMKCQHIVALFVIIYSKDSVPKNIENTLAKYYEESLWNNISRICYDYFDEKGLDIEAGVKETDGEIYTECENLFYYIVKATEVKGKTLLIYNLDVENDYVLIENINLNSKEVFYEKKKLFTPYGVKEFLKFRGFYVKEIWGDTPFGKVTFNTKTLLLRMVKYGN